MLVSACVAKIHRATVTAADPNYVGSITIDMGLMEACGLQEKQYLNITNCSNGFFWRTYAMAGPRGGGDICLNGPPSRHFQKGDKIIILAEALIDPSEIKGLTLPIVFVDDWNHITDVKTFDELREIRRRSA